MSATASAIRRAFYDAQSRRPYHFDAELIRAIVPPGGEWECVASDGAITRSIKWGHTEVALLNPAGQIDDTTEGQIAMAFRALPLIDATLRSIIVLAESAENLQTIRDLAISVVAFIEMPAPRISEPVEEDDGEDGEDLSGAED
jgi:hypothetical protein